MLQFGGWSAFYEFPQDRPVQTFPYQGGRLKEKFLLIVSCHVCCWLGRALASDGALGQTAAHACEFSLPRRFHRRRWLSCRHLRPQVSFQGGQLTISAQNSTLGDILKAVRAQTGATIDLPGNASERVVGHLGPAPARDVLTALLNGSHFNYLLLGSPTDPAALDRVILMAKSGGSPERSNPQPPRDRRAPITRMSMPVRCRPWPHGPAPGGNVVVEGQDAQEETTDDSTDTTDRCSQLMIRPTK